MIFNLLKQKPIKITAYVNSDYAFANTYSPIAKASSFVPNWWKNLPILKNHWTTDNTGNATYEFSTNVKNCMGIVGTFQTGYITPMWCELAIKYDVYGNWSYHFSDQKSFMHKHHNGQMQGFYDDYYKFKINSPWILECSEDIDILLTDPFYTKDNSSPYTIPYAISRTINKHMFLNIFLFLPIKSTELLIEHNTPIQHIIPLVDRPIEFKTEVISNEDYNRRYINTGGKITFSRVGFNKIKVLRNLFNKERL